MAAGVGRVQELTNLTEALERELPVVRSRQRPQQRKTLEPEQVCERVLVDHGRVHEPFRMPT